MLKRVVLFVLVTLLWSVGVEAQDEPEVPFAPPPPKITTTLNLSPSQSWVHLFCDRAASVCSVTFWCGQQTGNPVTWNVEVEAGRIFTYSPGKTDTDGNTVNLEAVLNAAGWTADEARRRTTCIVRSNDPIEARAYTYISGQIVPVANQGGTAAVTRYAPTDQAAFDGRFVGKRMEWNLPTRNHYDTTSPGRFRLTTVNDLTLAGDYTYENTGPNTATITATYDESNLACGISLAFNSPIGGTGTWTCSDGSSRGPANWRVVEIPVEPVGHPTVSQSATAVGIDSVTPAELQNGEADYYRIDVTRSGTLTVHTEGVVDTVGVFSPLDNAWFSRDDSGGSGENFRITQQVTPGTYIVAVRGAHDGDVGRYAFHVAFSSEADRNTPRVIPTAVRANSITAGELADGAVAYYRIEVPQAGALAVRADSDTDTIGVLWPGNRTPLENGWTNSWDDDGYDRYENFQIAERVSAGTYFVAVSEFVGAYGYSDGYDEDYTLYMHYAATGAAEQGNSILERARSVAPNSDTPGVLAGSQPDYYRIEVPGPGTLTIETTGDTETYGMLSPLGNEWFSPAGGGGDFGYTYDAERGTFVQGDYRGEGFEIGQSVSAGTYIVAVVGAYDDTGPYNLRVRFSSGRPTSVRITPVPIAPNSTTSGSPRASYYRIDVPRAGTLTLSTTGSNGTVGLLLPGNRTPLDNGWLLSWDDGNRGDFRIVERVSAGTYLVIVSEKRGLPYTFQSSFGPS